MNRIKSFLILFLLVCATKVVISQKLPADFPGIHTYKTGETGEGYVFLTVSSDIEGVGYYIFMIDDDGNPFKYKKLKNDYSYDFKVQPNGLMSYAHFLSHHSYTGGGNCTHMIMDANMNDIDSFQLKNGYVAEAHDFQLLPNGHALAFGYYLTPMDLSDILEGGNPDARVSGGIIQEFDQEKNVVWQWRSWDYYKPEDFTFGRRIGGEIISAFHLNTLNMDKDNNLILATPAWTKKINRQTGEIMWHLGGEENQFSFIGVDSLEGVNDVTGHAFHRLENGNFLIYDNGPRKGEGTSEAHEYRIDEENFTAEKIMTFSPDTAIAGWHRGNAQRLPGGNTLVGWGGARGEHIPIATEFDSTGNIVLKVYFDNPMLESYRAVRYPYPPSPIAKQNIDVSQEGIFPLLTKDNSPAGVSLEVNSAGSNDSGLTLTLFNYAPLYPEFNSRAPRVVAKRLIVEGEAEAGIDGSLIFSAEETGIEKPEEITIAYRVNDGEGIFAFLPTSYDPSTGEIKTESLSPGEYILTYPDVDPVPIHPFIAYPADSQKLNFKIPAKIEWSPKGFFTHFRLQIATDSSFSEPVVDSTGLRSTVYFFNGMEANSRYFWRVKTFNEAGESTWSDTAVFTAVAPYIEVIAPAGGENWATDSKHFIEWEDNLDEAVVLELFKDSNREMIIDTVEERMAYNWHIPAELDSACSYFIRIRSILDPYINAVSRETFSVSAQCMSDFVPYVQVLSPNGGEVYIPGDQVEINWQNNTNQAAGLSLYKENEEVAVLASNLTENKFTWLIPEDIELSDKYRVKIQIGNSEYFSDMSNSSFSVGHDLDMSAKDSDLTRKDMFTLYPVPVNDILNIQYTIQEPGNLNIRIFDMTGKVMGTIQTGKQMPGRYNIQYNMSEFSAGTYIISFVSGKESKSKLLICR